MSIMLTEAPRLLIDLQLNTEAVTIDSALPRTDFRATFLMSQFSMKFVSFKSHVKNRLSELQGIGF